MSTPNAEGFAFARDAAPTVATTAERNARFPSPPLGFKVYNNETNALEKYTGAGWAIAANVGLPVFDANLTYGASTSASGAVNQAAFLAAFNAAIAAGGGRVIATPGTYQITGGTTQSLPVPVSGTNFTTSNQSIFAHFYLLTPTGLVIDMPGVNLQSTKTDGGEMFLLNGPRNCRINIGRMTSPTAVSGGAVTVAGVEGIAVTTTTRDGWNLDIPTLHCANMYTAFYCFGDPASSFRMRGITIGDLFHDTGEYGIALHDNGDDVTWQNCVTTSVGRPFFLFGVDNVHGRTHNRLQLGGLQALVKAYDRDTTNIDLAYRIVTGNNSVAGLGFQSQHHVATQPTPGALRNVRVWYDDTGSVGGGLGIQFDYLQDAVVTSTVNTSIFSQITLAGTLSLGSSLASSVQQVVNPSPVLTATDLLLNGVPSVGIHAQGGWRPGPALIPYSRFGPTAASRMTLGQLGDLADNGASVYGNGTGELVTASDIARDFDKTGTNERFRRTMSNGNFDTYAPNGAIGTAGWLTESITLATGATTTDSVANLLPANAIIDAVLWRVTTTITTAANFSFGDATTAARFFSASTGLTAGSTGVGLAHMSGAVTTLAAGPTQATAAKLRITCNANPGAGVIRVTVFYRTWTPPTS